MLNHHLGPKARWWFEYLFLNLEEFIMVKLFSERQVMLPDADEELLQHIFTKSPRWLYDHKPFWVIFKHPEWVAMFEPKQMIEAYPHYMITNKPEVVANLAPELMWVSDFEKLVMHNPRWLVQNKRPQLAYMKPSLLAQYDPGELLQYRTEKNQKKVNRLLGYFKRFFSVKYHSAKVEYVAIPKEYMPEPEVDVVESKSTTLYKPNHW